MSNGDPIYNKQQYCLVQCTGWPHCTCGQRGYMGDGVYMTPSPSAPPKGCICPPTAEQTCQRWDCGRKSVGTTVR